MFKWFKKNIENAESYYDIALKFAENGDYDKAILNYHKSIEMNPNSTKVYYSMGISYAEKGDYDNALLNWRKVVEVRVLLKTKNINLP